MRARTTILITHRPDLVWKADRVVLIDGARGVQEGTPAELAARDGAFAALFGRADAARRSRQAKAEALPLREKAEAVRFS
jgi:ABC-type transport system involved in cytochrome bd biosynthesis fused ATPase/permease subunit